MVLLFMFKLQIPSREIFIHTHYVIYVDFGLPYLNISAISVFNFLHKTERVLMLYTAIEILDQPVCLHSLI